MEGGSSGAAVVDFAVVDDVVVDDVDVGDVGVVVDADVVVVFAAVEVEPGCLFHD